MNSAQSWLTQELAHWPSPTGQRCKRASKQAQPHERAVRMATAIAAGAMAVGRERLTNRSERTTACTCIHAYMKAAEHATVVLVEQQSQEHGSMAA